MLGFKRRQGANIIHLGVGMSVMGAAQWPVDDEREKLPAVVLRPVESPGELGAPAPDAIKGLMTLQDKNTVVLVFHNSDGVRSLYSRVQASVDAILEEAGFAAAQDVVVNQDVELLKSVIRTVGEKTVLAAELRKIAERVGRFSERERELLQANNEYLERARQAEREAVLLREAVKANHEFHDFNSDDDDGGYRGSDIEKLNRIALGLDEEEPTQVAA